MRHGYFVARLGESFGDPEHAALACELWTERCAGLTGHAPADGVSVYGASPRRVLILRDFFDPFVTGPEGSKRPRYHVKEI